MTDFIIFSAPNTGTAIPICLLIDSFPPTKLYSCGKVCNLALSLFVKAEKILKNLGYNRKTIKSFIKTVQNHVASEFSDMKEIMMGKVPKRLLN